eukprot:CAMPEP_0180658258 /NCGR_PEP_ID=MMETSP1037_2-20121125/56901_1 /TAXON_ID=632150 /ORGANISM="Azadinium spinosum, Strain 3D9" /LENGTH=79 /DNA_ID=CAMNT_0022685119 /DNA_START=377 /DNA_END=616 /DNA_ORIENTATION=+
MFEKMDHSSRTEPMRTGTFELNFFAATSFWGVPVVETPSTTGPQWSNSSVEFLKSSFFTASTSFPDMFSRQSTSLQPAC